MHMQLTEVKINRKPQIGSKMNMTLQISFPSFTVATKRKKLLLKHILVVRKLHGTQGITHTPA